MRALILTAGALALAVPLGACKNNDQTDNTMNVDENLTAENIVSNDVTAIDAVTGDAANMAAESPLNDIGAENMLNSGGNMSSPAKPQPTKPEPKKPAAKAPASSTPSTDSASNAAANAAD